MNAVDRLAHRGADSRYAWGLIRGRNGGIGIGQRRFDIQCTIPYREFDNVQLLRPSLDAQLVHAKEIALTRMR